MRHYKSATACTLEKICLDAKKDYDHYFPHNNPTNVLRLLQKRNKKPQYEKMIKLLSKIKQKTSLALGANSQSKQSAEANLGPFEPGSKNCVEEFDIHKQKREILKNISNLKVVSQQQNKKRISREQSLA